MLAGAYPRSHEGPKDGSLLLSTFPRRTKGWFIAPPIQTVSAYPRSHEGPKDGSLLLPYKLLAPWH